MLVSNIKQVYFAQKLLMSKLPWLSHEYISFEDDKGNIITVTSYTMNITEFWLYKLSTNRYQNITTKEEKLYPFIKPGSD